MDSNRRTPEQAELEFNQQRAQDWRDAANRADIRNEPATAILFRNYAWILENGKDWFIS